ncbi:hypothetical protein BKA66DRAFT_464992 [Pyrenochaeta sp. MPI-SDFR-AT-0127]|nr:hypothetical protein BKA66DRAFT_464992 [Pyrenochaeta sp. MPI-SDFR-AT-0127]
MGHRLLAGFSFLIQHVIKLGARTTLLVESATNLHRGQEPSTYRSVSCAVSSPQKDGLQFGLPQRTVTPGASARASSAPVSIRSTRRRCHARRGAVHSSEQAHIGSLW